MCNLVQGCGKVVALRSGEASGRAAGAEHVRRGKALGNVTEGRDDPDLKAFSMGQLSALDLLDAGRQIKTLTDPAECVRDENAAGATFPVPTCTSRTRLENDLKPAAEEQQSLPGSEIISDPSSRTNKIESARQGIEHGGETGKDADAEMIVENASEGWEQQEGGEKIEVNVSRGENYSPEKPNDGHRTEQMQAKHSMSKPTDSASGSANRQLLPPASNFTRAENGSDVKCTALEEGSASRHVASTGNTTMPSTSAPPPPAAMPVNKRFTLLTVDANSDKTSDDSTSFNKLSSRAFQLPSTAAQRDHGVPREEVQSDMLQRLEDKYARDSLTSIPALHSFGPPSAEVYICARLWEQSHLLTTTMSQDVQASLLADATRAEDDYDCLQQLKPPWFPRNDERNTIEWARHVAAALRLPALGRLLFSCFLAHVRQQFFQNPVAAVLKLEALEKQIEAWKADSGEERIERQLLLKELRVGRRAVDLAVWSGDISQEGVDEGGLSLVSIRLLVEGTSHAVEELTIQVNPLRPDLSNQKTLLEVPEELRQFSKRMQELKIGSSLVKLPKWLDELIRLKNLDLYGCSGLAALPASVGKLSGLQTLNLEGCSGLKALPESVGELTGLQTLNLNRCNAMHTPPPHIRRGDVGSVLKFLKDINRGMLEEVDLQGASVEELPTWITRQTMLRTLDLKRCSGLKALPEWVGKLTGLQTLNLGGCSGLKALPESVRRLEGLRL